MMSPEKLELALFYIQKGWPVLFTHYPISQNQCSCGSTECSIGKHPLTKRGLHDATTSETAIRYILEKMPGCNLAIRTGKSSGIFVLDLDPRHGGDQSLRQLESKYGKLPDTVEGVTGSPGRHLLFKMPDIDLPCSVGKVGEGLDIRAEGGYIVAPPSLHVSGRKYFWDAQFHPADMPLADAPKWLLDLAGAGKRSSPKGKEYWRNLTSLEIPDGKRDDSIASIVGHLLRKNVDPHLVFNLIVCLNQTLVKPPLPKADIAKIMDSILRMEMKRRGEAP